MEQIDGTEKSSNSAGVETRKPDEQLSPVHVSRPWLPIIVTTSLVGVGVGGATFFVWASQAFSDVTAAVTFITGNTINLFILLAIAAQACIYWSQRSLMNKQWQVMQEQSTAMQKQLAVIERQEGVMRDALEETRNSMRYSQAAYITVKAIDATKFSLGEKIEVMVIYINSGSTPAYNVNVYSRGGARAEPFSFARDGIAAEFPDCAHSKGILGPHADTGQVFGTDVPLTVVTLAGLKTNPYHAWGVIFYQDIFKRDRWTQFCYVYREKREWAGENGHFEICADCNKTDDQENPN